MKSNTARAVTCQDQKENHGQDSAIPKRKTYRIPISNGIFEHYGALKDAIWLFQLYIDWTTKEELASDGSYDGIVLGAKPICDEDTSSAFRGEGRPSPRTI